MPIPIPVSLSADATLFPAPGAGKVVKVLGYDLSAAGTVSLIIEDTAGRPLAAHSFVAGSRTSYLAPDQAAALTTGPNAGLVFNVSAAVAVTGWVLVDAGPDDLDLLAVPGLRWLLAPNGQMAQASGGLAAQAGERVGVWAASPLVGIPSGYSATAATAGARPARDAAGGVRGNGLNQAMVVAGGLPDAVAAGWTTFVRYKRASAASGGQGIVGFGATSARLVCVGTGAGAETSWYDAVAGFSNVGPADTGEYTVGLIAPVGGSGTVTAIASSGVATAFGDLWSAGAQDLYLLSQQGSSNFSADTVRAAAVFNWALPLALAARCRARLDAL